MDRKHFVLNVVLWIAYALALASSVSHLAWAFGSLEFEGVQWLGWLPALAVDAGLAALAYAIQQRKRAKRDTRMLWLGVGVFAGISAMANFLHAMTVQIGDVTLGTFASVDVIALVKALVMSATLPVLVLYLGEVVSSDDAANASEMDKERKRLERQSPATALSALGMTPETRQLVASGDASLTKLAQSGADDSGLEQANETRKARAEMAVGALLAFYAGNPLASHQDASVHVGRSRQWVGAALADLEQAGRVKRNGNGVEVVK